MDALPYNYYYCMGYSYVHRKTKQMWYVPARKSNPQNVKIAYSVVGVIMRRVFKWYPKRFESIENRKKFICMKPKRLSKKCTKWFDQTFKNKTWFENDFRNV